MSKKAVCMVLVTGILMFTPGHKSYAQESQQTPGPDQYNSVIDQALDEVEEAFNQTLDEADIDEEVKFDDASAETDAEDSKEVEVLEEVNLIEDKDVEDLRETKIIPLLHAEASSTLR